MVCVNVLYDVGARDESPHRTGFAHLFEHLMFSGSVNIPQYDHHVEFAGGENNAFTNNDITNYYLTLPASAVETAFWLESDRMLGLAFSEKGLEVQKGVVVEEFRQRYLNQPYGDAWLLLRDLAYSVHPYRWPTIGLHPSHIEEAEMEEVRAFYARFYNPDNAVLAVAGNVKPDVVFRLAEKWFGGIPSGPVQRRDLPAEPPQMAERRKEVLRDVPANALYLAWHMVPRMHPDYYSHDLLSDILSAGNSSRFFNRLVKRRALFSELTAYVTGDLDRGLFVVTGKVAQGVDPWDAERAVLAELHELAGASVQEEELRKVQNKAESLLAFSELSLAERALNLAYFELQGDAATYNGQGEAYRRVNAEAVRSTAASLFLPQRTSTLHILSQPG